MPHDGPQTIASLGLAEGLAAPAACDADHLASLGPKLAAAAAQPTAQMRQPAAAAAAAEARLNGSSAAPADVAQAVGSGQQALNGDAAPAANGSNHGRSGRRSGTTGSPPFDIEAEVQVLRASDALLHRRQARSERSQRRLMHRLAAVASMQERHVATSAAVALLQIAVLLLLALCLYCSGGGGGGGAIRQPAMAAPQVIIVRGDPVVRGDAVVRGQPEPPVRAVIARDDDKFVRGGAEPAADDGGGKQEGGGLRLPLLALLPALPLLFYLWALWQQLPQQQRQQQPNVRNLKQRSKSAPANAARKVDTGPRSHVLADISDGQANGHRHSSDSSETSSDRGSRSQISRRSAASDETGAEQARTGLAAGSATAPDAADFDGWRDAPALLRLKPGLGQRLTGGGDPKRIPVNESRPFEFETDRFVGKAAIWIRNLPSSPPDLFAGQRRRSRISVQGRFKQRVCADDVLTGQEFGRATNMPAQWLFDQVFSKIAKAINPSVEIGPMRKPSALVPAAAMAQGMVISEPGQEPDISGQEDSEDCRLLGSQLCNPDGGPVTAGRRKAYFADAGNRRRTFFEPDKVYTFHIAQHLVDMSTYRLDLGFHKFDLAHHLDGQPLQFMMRPRGGDSKQQPFFASEVWHENLLPAARRHEE